MSVQKRHIREMQQLFCERRHVFLGNLVDSAGNSVFDDFGEAISGTETRETPEQEERENLRYTVDAWKETSEVHQKYETVSATERVANIQYAIIDNVLENIFALVRGTEKNDIARPPVDKETLRTILYAQITRPLTDEEKGKLQLTRLWYEAGVHNALAEKNDPLLQTNRYVFEKLLRGEKENNPKFFTESLLNAVRNNAGAMPEELRGAVNDITQGQEKVSQKVLQRRQEVIDGVMREQGSLTKNAPKVVQEITSSKKVQLLHDSNPVVANMAYIALHPGSIDFFSPEDKNRLIQAVYDVLHVKGDNEKSREKMEKMLSGWKRRGESIKEHGGEEEMEKFYMEQCKKNEHMISQIALYEIAEHVQAELMAKGEWRDNLETTGSGLLVGDPSILEGDYRKVYTMANNLLDKDHPENIAIAYGLKYAGLLTLVFNLMAFVQSGGENTNALGLAAMGAAGIYGGKQVLSRRILDSWLHPERKAFNELAAKAAGTERFLIFEFANNIAFYKQIDFSDKAKRKRFMNFKQNQSKTENKAIGAWKKHNKGKDAPAWFGRVSAQDFAEDGALHGILKEGADTTVLMNQDDSVTARMRRFRAIDFLYSYGIDNSMLDDLQRHAQGFVHADNRPFTQTEYMTGTFAFNRYSQKYQEVVNQRMEEIIASGKNL